MQRRVQVRSQAIRKTWEGDRLRSFEAGSEGGQPRAGSGGAERPQSSPALSIQDLMVRTRKLSVAALDNACQSHLLEFLVKKSVALGKSGGKAALDSTLCRDFSLPELGNAGKLPSIPYHKLWTFRQKAIVQIIRLHNGLSSST